MPLKNKQVQIIGLTGLASHGKTDVADAIVALTGFTRIAFGDAVKRACSAVYILPLEYFYEGDHGIDRNKTIVSPYGMTIRQMMTTMGDAMKNQHGGNFWINLMKLQIQHTVEDENVEVKGFIIEDIRYDEVNPWGEDCNEAGYVRSWGGMVCHVDASTRVGRTEVHESHHSENGVKRLEHDPIIDNNGSLEALAVRVQNFVIEHGLETL